MSVNDTGLHVEFDGNKNTVLGDGEVLEFPIGGMACEYARFHPTDVKQYIMKLSLFHNSDLKGNGADALLEFFGFIREEHGYVIANIVMTDFMNFLSDYNRANEEELKMLLEDCNDNKDNDEIKKFILENSGYNKFGVETIGQAFLSAYVGYAQSYVMFKVMFNVLATDGQTKIGKAEHLIDLYCNNIEFQHIDFSIMLYDNAFHSVYTIQSSLSLIIFEAAHVMEKKVNLIKCKNCGNYFVPIGRADQVYCGYLSPQDNKRACRDIGAQNTLVKKRKNDESANEYRRIYMRYKMAIKRHPDDVELKRSFDLLTQGMKTRRKERELGKLSTDDILEWLSDY